MDKTNRRSVAKSWLAVMVLAAGIFGLLWLLLTLMERWTDGEK